MANIGLASRINTLHVTLLAVTMPARGWPSGATQLFVYTDLRVDSNSEPVFSLPSHDSRHVSQRHVIFVVKVFLCLSRPLVGDYCRCGADMFHIASNMSRIHLVVGRELTTCVVGVQPLRMGSATMTHGQETA